MKLLKKWAIEYASTKAANIYELNGENPKAFSLSIDCYEAGFNACLKFLRELKDADTQKSLHSELVLDILNNFEETEASISPYFK
jgi:hypothetical protein